jgi:hypothetical protein
MKPRIIDDPANEVTKEELLTALFHAHYALRQQAEAIAQLSEAVDELVAARGEPDFGGGISTKKYSVDDLLSVPTHPHFRRSAEDMAKELFPRASISFDDAG